ncbi:hypothetical protein BD408DRAFT_404006 [Parasitella parasitica]|nr:hypothetical protein BD408DRAFT_404006 [Parasitella parasitica]
MSNADTQSNQIPVQAVSAPKEVHKLADLGQMDGSVIPQENSSLTTSIASKEQNLTTEMPPDQTEVAKPMTPSQELVNNTTNAFTTAFYSVSPQKSTESVSTSKIADELQQPSISNSLPTEKKQFSGIFIKSALEGAKDFLETVKNSPLDNHHLHLQPKSTHVMAASAQKKLIVGICLILEFF